MIVDCHTHIWSSEEQLGRAVGQTVPAGQAGRGMPRCPRADTEAHLLATQAANRVFVLALKSHYLDAEVSNDEVAAYVRSHPTRLIGFAAVDPSRPKEAIDDLRRAHEEMGLRGVTIWPAAQDFHPAHSAAMRVYTEVCRREMPLLFHQDIGSCQSAIMEFARPYLVDEVAREFPTLKIVVSQLGYPWTEEAVALLAKHRNVFADISGLLDYPWKAYNALLAAFQAGVMDRLLFGSNFPYGTTATCIESLYSINQFSHGTALPAIPREQLRQIVERDTLNLLGIQDTAPQPRPQPDTTVIRIED